MLKIRLDGTENEINDFIKRLQYNYCPDKTPIAEIKSISKFYPNTRNSIISGAETGRVYLEVQPKN